MSIPHLYPAQSELFEYGRRIEAEMLANHVEGLASGVVLDCRIYLLVVHAPWPLAHASSIKMLAHSDSVDLELLSNLVDSHPL
mgnify:CR=1 FL=1